MLIPRAISSALPSASSTANEVLSMASKIAIPFSSVEPVTLALMTLTAAATICATWSASCAMPPSTIDPITDRRVSRSCI